MNQKEQRIISNLRKDARTSLAAISHDVEMPISTIYDKINKLNRDNVITRYAALVDFTKMGFHHHMKLVVKVARHQRKELSLFLQKNAALNSLREISGGFIAELIHRDAKEYLAFVEGLQENFEVEVTEYQVLADIKREGAFVQSSHIPELHKQFQ
jgi:DNA-binding Lrp family transcriptional regulator